jgi:hypothetical protein
MKAMEMEGMEGAILIFMLGNMEQTVARKQTKRGKNNAQKRTEGWKQKGIWRGSGVCFLPDGVL